MTQGLQFDASIMESEEEDDPEPPQPKPRGRRKSTEPKPKKKRPRKKKSNRGYYASSDEAEADAEAAETAEMPPPAKRLRQPNVDELLGQVSVTFQLLSLLKLKRNSNSELYLGYD